MNYNGFVLKSFISQSDYNVHDKFYTQNLKENYLSLKIHAWEITNTYLIIYLYYVNTNKNNAFLKPCLICYRFISDFKVRFKKK